MKKLLLTLGAIASVAAPVAAVVACGTTPTKTPTHLDEGFNNASLIENFNIADEEATTKTVSGFSIDGKSYDVTDAAELKAFITKWAEDVNRGDELVNSLATYKTQLGLGYKTLSVTAEVNGGAITLDLVDENNDPVRKLQPKPRVTSIDHFKDDANTFIPFPEYKTTWKDSHKFVAGSTVTEVPPVKKDSINSILYTEAHSLSNKVDTNHDKVYAVAAEGSSDIYSGHKDEFDIMPFTGINYTAPISAEVRGGDSLVIAFDNPGDIASFTERVKYIDASTASGIMVKDEASITTPSYVIKNGKIVAQTPNPTDYKNPVRDLFVISAFANNAIKITFNSITDTSDLNGQSLVLAAFEDTNKDGKINHDDVSMISPFYITNNHLTSSAQSLINKENFIFGHAEAEGLPILK